MKSGVSKEAGKMSTYLFQKDSFSQNSLIKIMTRSRFGISHSKGSCDTNSRNGSSFGSRSAVRIRRRGILRINSSSCRSLVAYSPASLESLDSISIHEVSTACSLQKAMNDSNLLLRSGSCTVTSSVYKSINEGPWETHGRSLLFSTAMICLTMEIITFKS